MFKQLNTVFKKELLDARRDAKSLATALLMPIIFAAVTLGTLHFIANMQTESQGFTLPIVGMEKITPVVKWLEESGITVVNAPEKPVEALLNNDWDVILAVPDGFSEEFRAQRSARLDLLSDHSDTQAQAKSRRVHQLLMQWSNTNGALRLLARDISPEIANVIQVNTINVANNQRVATKIIGGLPLIIMLIAFVGGVGMSSDMAAGERERKSLEPLLINPISRQAIFLGKWLATVVISFVITCLGVGLQIYSVNIAPLAELGLRIDLGFTEFILMVIILIPVIFIASSLQLLVSLYAKSFKDSQSYNSLVMLIPTVPGMYVMFNAGSAELKDMLIPLLGPQTLLVNIIGGDGAAISHIFLSSLVSVALAVFLGWLAVIQLKRENIIFN